jgi:hypothetical protein
MDCLILSSLEAALIRIITVLPDFNGNLLRIEAVRKYLRESQKLL